MKINGLRIPAVWLPVCASILFVFPPAAIATPGRIVVNYDDWTLSDSWGGPPNDPAVYAQNIAGWFTEGRPGSFIAYDREGDWFHHLNIFA